MDILNWIYLKTNELIRPTANNTNTDIIALGANVGPIQRGDSYQTYGMTIQDFANTIATLIPPPPPVGTGLFAQTVNSIPVTNTTTETSITGTGVGSLSVPANGFQVGDSFHAKLIGMMSTANNHTIRIRIKSGSVLLADTGVITLGNSTNRPFEINVYFTIKSLGTAGVASIVSGGIFSYTKNASVSFEGTGFNTVNNTTFDTTVSNTLDVTAQWGQTSASDSVYTDLFVLHKLY
jgi:hypothetical protein